MSITNIVVEITSLTEITTRIEEYQEIKTTFFEGAQ